MKAKILIVGGGIMGTSIAIEAARRTDALRAPVVLFEKRAMGAASVGRSAGILRLNYADREVAVMARDSLRDYSAFEARSGRTIGFQKAGVLTIASPEQPEWIARLQANVALANDIGIPLELVDAAGIRRLVDGVAVRSGSVGAWEPLAGHVNPEATMHGFASLARSYGAVTRVGVEVTEIKVEGGRVVGVETTEGDCVADHVVVAAGAWTDALLRKLGVTYPLRTMRSENVFFAHGGAPDVVDDPHDEERGAGLGFDMEDDPYERAEAQADAAVPGHHPVIIDLEHGFFCRSEPSLRLRVGRTEYYSGDPIADPDQIRGGVSPETVAWAHEKLCARLPGYADRPHTGSSVGWHTVTPDAQAILGPVEGIAGLWVATGFSGHGFKLAPSVGEGLAQMLFDEPITAFDPEFFSPARFDGTEEWHGKFGL